MPEASFLDASYFYLVELLKATNVYKGYLLVTWNHIIVNGIMVRVFANCLGDLVSIPGRVIPKTKIVLDATLFNTQHYKVKIKSKVEQSRGRSSALHYTLV